jgi:hypothetical protein
MAGVSFSFGSGSGHRQQLVSTRLVTQIKASLTVEDGFNALNKPETPKLIVYLVRCVIDRY